MIFIIIHKVIIPFFESPFIMYYGERPTFSAPLSRARHFVGQGDFASRVQVQLTTENFARFFCLQMSSMFRDMGYRDRLVATILWPTQDKPCVTPLSIYVLMCLNLEEELHEYLSIGIT